MRLSSRLSPHPRRLLGAWWLAAALCAAAASARAEDTPEYRLKAAILYNFALFTEWPPAPGTVFNLCVVGRDPFGADIDALQGKLVGARSVVVQRKAETDSLAACHLAFIAASSGGALPRVVDALRGQPVLTVADTPGAARQGVTLNLALAQGRISFEANVAVARAAGVQLSSKLLRLATEVHQ